MARSRSSKASGGDIMKQMQDWCGDNCDPLSIVCAIVVVAYIGLANPSNTPAFFGSTVFKVLIFAVVVIVTLMDTKIGVIFGLAMVLSVSYSYIRPSPTTQEPFYANPTDDEEGAAATEDVSYPEETEEPTQGTPGEDETAGAAGAAGAEAADEYVETYAPYQSM